MRARSKTGSTCAAQIEDAESAASAPGTGPISPQLGDLEHVLDRERVALAADADAARGTALIRCCRVATAPFAETPSSVRVELVTSSSTRPDVAARCTCSAAS